MKNIIFPIIFLIFFACSPSSDKLESDSDSLKSQAEKFLKTGLKDPSTYEKISCEITDSITKSTSLTEKLDYLYTESLVERGLFTKVCRDSIKNIIADLKINPSKDSIAHINIDIQYRAKNSFGALDIGHAIIYYFPKTPPSGKQFMIYSNK